MTTKTGKTAIMIGAGNIGRGFVGAAFAASGYETIFVDVSDELVNEINARGEYPVRILLPDGGRTDTMVQGVRAINGKDVDKAAEEIARADICATAVGVRALPFVAPMLGKALEIRFRSGGGPLNTIICENMIDAGEHLRQHVREHLPAGLGKAIDDTAGYPEAVIGRMVPTQTDEMKDGDPLRVCVEKYAFLPVDKEAFKGQIPKVEGMVALEHFGYYTKRKLFVHNMGHAALGYLGLLKGYTYVAEAADDGDILYIVRGAMRESAAALNLENPGDTANLNRNIDSLIYRCTNRALGDTCARVAADPIRKLGKADRIIGALENCETYGLPTIFIAAVAAAANLILEKNWDGEGAPPPLSDITGLPINSEAYKLIMTLGISGVDVTALRRAVQKLAGDIVIL